jgi:hypothetical protein
MHREGINGGLGFLFIVVADRSDLAGRWLAPRLPGEEAGKDPAVADLPDAFGGAADKFIKLRLVVGQEAPCPEGTIHDGGVEDVHGGLGEGALGGVIDAERDRKGKREVHRLVGDPILEVEGVGACYVCVAGQYLGGRGIDKADERASDVDWSELRAEEPGVVAPMAD